VHMIEIDTAAWPWIFPVVASFGSRPLWRSPFLWEGRRPRRQPLPARHLSAGMAPLADFSAQSSGGSRTLVPWFTGA